jgi:hypothetical protein
LSIFAEMMDNPHRTISQEYFLNMAGRNGTTAVWSDSGVVTGCGPTFNLTSVLSIFIDVFSPSRLCNFAEVRVT